MEPAAKKRRLAPKLEAQPQPVFQEHTPQAQHYQAQEVVPAPPPPERHEFESFARHLQDAAMLIYSKTQNSPYSKVSVLLLQWEDDNAVEQDLGALEQVLRERYNYRTYRWRIQATGNFAVKLGVRMASFLENASPDHLLMVVYSGHGYLDADRQLVWASNTKKYASKLKWNSFCCLFEEAQCDMLLMLDTCATREAPISGGSHGTKQVLAASGPEHNNQESGGRSFTAHAAEAFLRLSAGRPFTTEHIYQEIATQRQQDLVQNGGLTNGAAKSTPVSDNLPVIYTLSSGNGQSLSLSPLPPSSASHLQSPLPGADGDAHQSRSSQDQIIHPNSVADLTFDEPRVLVCTTFVGEASSDMSSFNQWLHNSPAIASKVAVEGMFLGPPTMLLISMPVPVWNVVQHDKVCCFLGYVNSHNMTHLYKRLIGSASPSNASAKDMADGRILLEARQVAATKPVVNRYEHSQKDANHVSIHPETTLPDGLGRIDPMSLPQSSVTAGLPYTNLTPVTVISKPDDVESTAEMKEAAEQLSALSHVRHMRDEMAATAHVTQASLMNHTPEVKHDDASSHETNESGMKETQYGAELNTPSSKPKQRRSLQKTIPKQETRCNLCSHTPFKDSSSLRKHIAAAHTRPFPCAFAFSGCSSTFGSKNEWKRHIASQHLCLQYYRCSSCPQSTIEGKGNEFNRKDLFTQHLRRMHAPFQIKKALAKDNSKLQMEWENHVKEMQQSCLVQRRQPPQRSACPKPDCSSIFEGPTSWDEWTEHVGRHMEKGDAARLGVDRLLAKWALDEGIIERKEDSGEYRLCSGTGNPGEKEVSNNNAGNHSDGNNSRDEERTIVAASTMILDQMDVD